MTSAGGASTTGQKHNNAHMHTHTLLILILIGAEILNIKFLSRRKGSSLLCSPFTGQGSFREEFTMSKRLLEQKFKEFGMHFKIFFSAQTIF